MARKAKKAGHSFTKKRRAKLSAAATRRHVKRRNETPAAAKKKRRHIRTPSGIRVLSRNGRGKDIIECDADSVIIAIRAIRKLRKLV